MSRIFRWKGTVEREKKHSIEDKEITHGVIFTDNTMYMYFLAA